MTGKYDVILYNNRVHYHLVVKRNITVLRGDSATGKSELIRLLAMFNANPKSSGITLICDRDCTVLNEGNWRLFLEHYQGRIFFIDEGNAFLRTKEFAAAVKTADNYFVIVSRESLPQLPYSVDEIYGLREDRESEKYRVPKRAYNELYKIYCVMPNEVMMPELVITEDSNSGHEFFEILFPDNCISAHGKSNIKQMLMEHRHKRVLAIVDGAAFGSEMQACVELAEASDKGVSIYAPESFEYLILKSRILKVPKAIVEETWEYADSKRYISWEDYYTSYLSGISRNEVFQYSKTKLNGFYKTQGNMARICEVMPEYIQGNKR